MATKTIGIVGVGVKAEINVSAKVRIEVGAKAGMVVSAEAGIATTEQIRRTGLIVKVFERLGVKVMFSGKS
jgi:hypothetical protein